MAKQEFYERRGTMVYTEDYRPGKARIVHEAGTVEDADTIVERLNDRTITEESLKHPMSDRLGYVPIGLR